MTIFESNEKLKEIRGRADELVKKFNEARTNGDYKTMTTLDVELNTAIDEYSTTKREQVFSQCKAAPDPMLDAVETLTYLSIITRDKYEGEKGMIKTPTRIIEDREFQIDLRKLDKYCGGIGANKNWQHIAQKMNFLLTAKTCQDLGIDPKGVSDTYLMTQIARDFEMGKTPTSNTQLLNTLQIVISAMLGEGYKATSHDVKFLVKTYTKKNREALALTCLDHRGFIRIIAEVCHRIVLNLHYKVAYKTIKK